MTAKGAKQPYRRQRRRWGLLEKALVAHDLQVSPYVLAKTLGRTSTAIRVMRKKLERVV